MTAGRITMQYGIICAKIPMACTGIPKTESELESRHL